MTFTAEQIQNAWGKGTTVSMGKKEFTVHRMSYGDYFLQPTKYMFYGERDGFPPGTKWLEKKIVNRLEYFDVVTHL